MQEEISKIDVEHPVKATLQNVKTEFDKVKSVILCKPVYFNFEGVQITNETLGFWMRMGYPPKAEEAVKQHERLVEILRENGVKIYFLKSIESCPYQVYTRDLGSSIDSQHVFVSRMKYSIREKELPSFLAKLQELGKKVLSLSEDATFEGGNLLIYDKQIAFLGISERTNRKALEILKKALQPMKIIPVKLPERIIHLDVVMNFANKELAVLYKNSVPDPVERKLKKKFQINIIQLNRLQQFTLSSNFFPIKENTVIVAQENYEVNKKLIEEGVDVIEVPYREMIKGGGAIRCTTFPLERG